MPEKRLNADELDLLVNGLPFAVAVFDPGYRVVHANKAFWSQIKVSKEDVLGRHCYETVGEYANSPDKNGREKICSFCRADEALKTGKKVEIVRPCGTGFIKVTTVPQMDGSGNILHFLEIIEDITEEKRSRHELELREETYRTIIENSPT